MDGRECHSVIHNKTVGILDFTNKKGQLLILHLNSVTGIRDQVTTTTKHQQAMISYLRELSVNKSESVKSNARCEMINQVVK